MFDADDEFRSFESIGAVLGYVAAKLGLDAARDLLAQGGFRRETLVREANILRKLGLTDLAKATLQQARKAPPTPPTELPFDERLARRA